MITSKQNQTVKLIRSLSDKKFRDEHGLYVVSGVKLVKEVLSSSHKVVSILATDKHFGEFSKLFDGVETVTSDIMDYVSYETTPQGVIAIVEKPTQSPIETNATCVLLDGVSDPGNVGAIIRSMAGAGYGVAFLTSDCADPFSPKAVRASMSGIFKVKTYSIKREDALKYIRCPLIVAEMGGEDVFSFNTPKEFCLVIGNEGRGISPEIREKAQSVVRVPMQNGIESLNASVSAGILMYELKIKK